MYLTTDPDDRLGLYLPHFVLSDEKDGLSKQGYRLRISHTVTSFDQTLINEKLPRGAWYIITIFNRHHQLFLNPSILAVNFDIAKKEMIQSWRYDQLYPGYHYPTAEDYKLDRREYDEWGVPYLLSTY